MTSEEEEADTPPEATTDAPTEEGMDPAQAERAKRALEAISEHDAAMHEAQQRAQTCHDLIADACAKTNCRLQPVVQQEEVGAGGDRFITTITFRIVANSAG